MKIILTLQNFSQFILGVFIFGSFFESQATTIFSAGENLFGNSNNTENQNPNTRQLLMSTFFSLQKGPMGSRPKFNHGACCGVRNISGTTLGNEHRIANEREANINEFPWRVSISTKGQPAISLCAGALISDFHVLTSASCLVNRRIEHLLVNLGDHDLDTRNETQNFYLGIKAATVHPNYKMPPLGTPNKMTAAHLHKSDGTKTTRDIEFNQPIEDFDIALLTLSTSISEKNILPICLPFKSTSKSISKSESKSTPLFTRDLTGTSMVTSGWNFGGKLTKSVLTYYSASAFARNVGPRNFPNVIKSTRVINLQNFVFTYDNDEIPEGIRESTDPNKGVSQSLELGSSLDHLEVSNGLYYIMGLADWFKSHRQEKRATGDTREDITMTTTGMLGVWTDVTKYLDWIENSAKGTDFCRPSG